MRCFHICESGKPSEQVVHISRPALVLKERPRSASSGVTTSSSVSSLCRRLASLLSWLGDPCDKLPSDSDPPSLSVTGHSRIGSNAMCSGTIEDGLRGVGGTKLSTPLDATGVRGSFAISKTSRSGGVCGRTIDPKKVNAALKGD